MNNRPEFKPSMFNYISYIEDEMFIYNSYVGITGTRKVLPEHRNAVSQALSGGPVEECIKQELIDGGFMVGVSVNEKNRRTQKYLECVCSDTLLLVIHTTKNCNFRCPYCNLEFVNENLSEDVERRIIRFVQRNLSQYKTVQIDWFGGEPLMNMESIERISKELISICDRAKKVYRATITTNGYLLTPDFLERLMRCRVHVFSITMDGLEATHNVQRVLANGKGTHTTIMSNLLFIRDHVKNSKVRVIIRTNLTRPIISSLKEYYNYYNSRFKDDSRFSMFVRPALDIGGSRVFQIADTLVTKEEYDSALFQLAQFAGKDGLKFSNNHTDLDTCGYSCPAIMRGKYTISVDGIVSKCDSVDIGNELGKLSSSGEIIKTGQYGEEDWLGICFRPQAECEDCFFSISCFKCKCPLNLIEGKPFSCKIDTAEIDSTIRLYSVNYSVKEL